MKHLSGKDSQHMLIIDKDEPLVATLTNFATQQSLAGGLISGIGALKDVELGYYDLHNKEYIRKTFNEMDYELISLSGNISLKESKPFIHVHASLGDMDFNVFGGHLFEATVAVTTEIFITPLGVMPERRFDQCIGLALIS